MLASDVIRVSNTADRERGTVGVLRRRGDGGLGGDLPPDILADAEGGLQGHTKHRPKLIF